MDRMALIGRGAVAYLSLNDDPVEIMNRFNERISHPAMTDLSIDWGNMNVTDVYPQILPDLIVGRPVVVTGRFTGEPSSVTVGGRTGMQPISFTVAVDCSETRQRTQGNRAVWARLKIMDLMTQFSARPIRLPNCSQTVTADGSGIQPDEHLHRFRGGGFHEQDRRRIRDDGRGSGECPGRCEV